MEQTNTADDADATALAEIMERATKWNATPRAERERLLPAALMLEATGFVAHSNALEGVPTLSASDTHEMVLQTAAARTHDTLTHRAAENTYRAHRLAHAFRRERAAAPGARAADELLWQLPHVLAVHRELMRNLHDRAGRLRDTEARPEDRDRLYVTFTAVEPTAWSFFDVFNSRVLRIFGDDTEPEGVADVDEDALDVDGAVAVAECTKLLDAPALAPDVRDIDVKAIVHVVKLAAWAAVHFLEIHPFADGNGRLARILVDTLLAKIHPVPAPLSGLAIDTARERYIAALREVPPWGTSDVWAAEPTKLVTFILESLVASWRRMALIQECAHGGGDGPWLGVVTIPVRASAGTRLVRYMRLRHKSRTPTPTREQLAAEADSMVPPTHAPMTIAHAPTGNAKDCWLHITWLA